jgi:hypothetical protein
VLVCGPLSARDVSGCRIANRDAPGTNDVTCCQLSSRNFRPELAILHYAAGSLLTPPTLHKMALVAYRNLLRSARIAFEGTIRITWVGFAAHTVQAT